MQDTAMPSPSLPGSAAPWTTSPPTWRVRLVVGGLHSVVQVLALGLTMLLWRSSPGWSAGQFALYFATLSILAPIAGRVLVRSVVLRGVPLQAWRAWPVGVATLIVLLVGHGFEEAGLGPIAPLVTLALLAFAAGAGSFWAAQPAVESPS
jgi:hypothetical protein